MFSLDVESTVKIAFALEVFGDVFPRLMNIPKHMKAHHVSHRLELCV
jgi:hypothetical protein